MSVDATTAFGTLLRRHRMAAGLTQETLAERAGLSVYGIQKLERGTTHPYRDTAERLVAALELPPDAAEQLWAAVKPVRRHGSLPRGGRRDNLPVGLTSFVGREKELATIAARLKTVRLLTLTGVGGCGKTRLAIEAARAVSERYRDGVRLVELAPVTDAALVPHRLGAVLDVREAADRPLAIALAETLGAADMLLVLDNCEHVLDACAALIDLLLRECPYLQILATSREQIGMPGEVIWSLGTLASPATDEPGSVDEMEQFPAVRLFVERASTADPTFTLADANVAAVAQICRRLDGIPLAIELAAARLDALTAHQLAGRLDQRFKLLTNGNRAGPGRQQTLAGTIEWSYLLLSQTQQRVFERLSVFARGWTLEAAEAVCAGDGVGVADVLEAVLQLIRKSLVVRIDVRHGVARYGLLETLRQYALEKLLGRAGELPGTRENHAVYYSGLVERLDPAAPTTLLSFSGETPAAPIIETLDAAHDNVRLALKWWLDAGRVRESLVLIRALGTLWQWVGIPVEGPHWVAAALDLAAQPEARVPPALHAQALMFGAVVVRALSDHDKGRALLETSIALWTGLGDDVGLALAVSNLGISLLFVGELEQADAVLSQAVALARSAGNAFAISATLTNLASACRTQDQHERAAAVLQDALVAARAVERPSDRTFSVLRALVHLARVESDTGAHARAMPLFREALTRMRESGLAGPILAYCLDWLAAELGRTGDDLGAAQLFGAAEAQWRRAGGPRFPYYEASYHRDVRAVAMRLDDDAFAQQWNVGRAMSVADVVSWCLER
jgi:non-specific serine/threonine protein kinase